MTTIDFTYPGDHAVPVPFEQRSPAEHAEWAEATARELAPRFADVPDFASRVEAALADLASRADDAHRLFLVISPDGSGMAPLVVSVADAPLTRAEQAAFLWSPSVILPPTPDETETAHLGAGFSVTLLQEENGVQFATRRWLFLGENGAVGAVLGPVAPYSLVIVEGVAELILEGSRVDGFVPSTDRTRIDELHAQSVRSGESWKL